MEIACDVSGSGRPLVLVHGAGSARWGFDVLRPLLEDRFSVIAIDRRGRGESGDAPGPYAIESEFEDVAAVVRDAGLTVESEHFAEFTPDHPEGATEPHVFLYCTLP